MRYTAYHIVYGYETAEYDRGCSMKIAELIVKLQGVLAVEGNLQVFTGDMVAVDLTVEVPTHAEDFFEYGHKYVFVGERHS